MRYGIKSTFETARTVEAETRRNKKKDVKKKTIKNTLSVTQSVTDQAVDTSRQDTNVLRRHGSLHRTVKPICKLQ